MFIPLHNRGGLPLPTSAVSVHIFLHNFFHITVTVTFTCIVTLTFDLHATKSNWFIFEFKWKFLPSWRHSLKLIMTPPPWLLHFQLWIDLRPLCHIHFSLIEQQDTHIHFLSYFFHPSLQLQKLSCQAGSCANSSKSSNKTFRKLSWQIQSSVESYVSIYI